MECCLELLEADLLVSLQDLGAAGLTSSACEMASAGGVGIDIDVARVPLRNPDLEPFEVMVSESQERMLAVVEPGKVDEVLAICRKWETGGTAIGEVTEGDRIRIFDGDEMVGDMPVTLLVDDCPLYDLEPAEPDGWIYGNGEPQLVGAEPSDTLLSLLATPTIASKRWAFEQYDSIVQSRTVRRPEQADAAVLQLPDAGTAIAVSIDGNGRRVALRSLRRHRRGGPRVRAEPRLRRRRAARPDQLPQLRQPREADRRLAARPLDPGARRRLRGARRAGRRRQRLALQRDRPRADLPDAGRRHGRRAALAGGAADGGAAPGRRDRDRRPVRAGARRLAAREAARRARPRPRRRSRSAPSRRRSSRSARRSAPGSSTPPTTSATAASPARSRSARSPAASACRSTSGR